MIQVSVILEIREIGPNGPGRGCVGTARKQFEYVSGVREKIDGLTATAFRMALERRQEHLDELARIATQQAKLW